MDWIETLIVDTINTVAYGDDDVMRSYVRRSETNEQKNVEDNSTATSFFGRIVFIVASFFFFLTPRVHILTFVISVFMIHL